MKGSSIVFFWIVAVWFLELDDVSYAAAVPDGSPVKSSNRTPDKGKVDITPSDSEHFVPAGVEIDRIDIKGVRVFSTPVIEETLEIGPGDKLEHLKVLRTEENLQSLYVRNGYEEVSIRSRLVRKRNEDKALETVLEFSIVEGRPVRIASVDFVSEGISDSPGQKAWKSRLKKMRSRLRLEVGDIYTQDRMAENRRILQEVLASAEYIGAKVDEVRFPSNPPQNLIGLGAQAQDVSKWVGIRFQVNLGERVNFGFRGNTVFTRGYLDGLVDEQRLLGLGKDYVGVIRSKLEDEYHSIGYARVEITPYTFESSTKIERKVTYVIHEGPRVKIENVEFDGNSVFSSEDLRKHFYERASLLIQHGFYVEKESQKAAELLIEWIKEKGYLSARVITTNANFPVKPKTQQQNSAVRLLVYLYEGEQTLVQSISIQGASVVSPSEIQKILQIQHNDPLNLFAFGEGIEALKKVYRDRGYLGFRIVDEGTDKVIQYSQEGRSAHVVLQVQEGYQYRVSHIEVEGLGFTLENVVRRELKIQTGEILKEPDLILSERQLRKLGIFSTVTIKTMDDPASPGYKTVRVILKEADRGVLSYGPGYRNDLGIRLFGQLSYTNLWGENHTLSLSASANRRFYNYNFGEGQAQVAYVWPWFGIPELNFRPTVAIGRTQYGSQIVDFFADNLTVSAGWDKQIYSSPNAIGYFTYSMEKIHQSGAANRIDNGDFQIGTVTPKISVDLRDSPLAPSSGYFGTAWLDLALPVFGSQTDPTTIGYYRFQMRSDYYLPLTRDIIWYFSFRGGFEQTLGDQYFIPLIKEFALGGIASIRGYPEQGIYNPYSLIGGSLSYVNYRTQVDFPFSGALKFGIFLDAGNLLVNNFSFGGLNYGTGFGLHYQTPVGPINFDWGFRVNPPVGADPYIIHFSVGVI